MSEVTVVLTHWKRAEGMAKVIDSLMTQTIRPTLWLWNNSGQPYDDPRVTWEVLSSQNMKCWPRWFLASQAATPFVMTHDDDLCMRDRRVLEDAVAALVEQPPGVIVAALGRQLLPGKTYADAAVVENVQLDTRVDTATGRFMLLRTRELAALPLRPPTVDLQQAHVHDDIIMSSLVAGGRRLRHLVPACLAHRFEELPQPHALWKQEQFYETRNAACARYFPD